VSVEAGSIASLRVAWPPEPVVAKNLTPGSDASAFNRDGFVLRLIQLG
jgi:hypothetical protein